MSGDDDDSALGEGSSGSDEEMNEEPGAQRLSRLRALSYRRTRSISRDYHHPVTFDTKHACLLLLWTAHNTPMSRCKYTGL